MGPLDASLAGMTLTVATKWVIAAGEAKSKERFPTHEAALLRG